MSNTYRMGLAAIVLMIPGRLLSADATEFDDFWTALRMDETIVIMREESLSQASELGEDMLASGGGASWDTQLDMIYDMDRLTGVVRSAMFETAKNEDLSASVAFFEGALGKRAVDLEIGARRAQLDDDISDAAEEVYRQAAIEGDARIDQIDRFIEAGDLIEANLAGALNSNFRFFQGFIEGGRDAVRMSEDQALANVQEQAEEIRQDTRDWLGAYFYMAYQPLSDEEMEGYVAFMDTSEGAVLTRVLFAGFDAMFAQTSYALGLAIGREIGAVDL